MSNETLDKIKEELSKLTAPQLSELISSLKEEWNVSDEAPVAMAVAGAEGAEVAEEKSEFTVVLKSIGDKKVNVIKEVKAITQLPLGDAKKLVDEAPKPVKEGVPKAEAEEMKKKLEEAGASVELQ